MYSSCYCIRSCPCVSCGVFGKHHNLLAVVYPCYRVRYLRTHSSINLIINQRILHKINNKTIISITKFTTQSLGMTYTSSSVARFPVSTTDRAIDKSFLVLAACFLAELRLRPVSSINRSIESASTDPTSASASK